MMLIAMILDRETENSTKIVAGLQSRLKIRNQSRLKIRNRARAEMYYNTTAPGAQGLLLSGLAQ
jgi:hypothetical protein